MKKLNETLKCAYCNQSEDGGKDLAIEKASLGALGNLEYGVTFWDYQFDHELDKDYKPHLTLWAEFAASKEYGHSLGKEPRIEIQYCPWCGRKLYGE